MQGTVSTSQIDQRDWMNGIDQMNLMDGSHESNGSGGPEGFNGSDGSNRLNKPSQPPKIASSVSKLIATLLLLG